MSSVDKEAQEKIADLIEIGKVNDHFPNFTARCVIEELGKLGYRKPPEGEQDLLLTPEEIVATIKKHDGDLAQMWNTRVVDGTLTVDSCMNYVLKAQLSHAEPLIRKDERERIINLFRNSPLIRCETCAKVEQALKEGEK